MLKLVLAAAGLAAVTVLSPLQAQTMWDVEHARANARAGGPTNSYDADILKRYGCLSGTRSALCEKLSHEGRRKQGGRADARR